MGADALTLRLPAALAVVASLLLIAATPWLGMVQSILVLPWFVPTVTALVCLALGVLAFLASLRYVHDFPFFRVPQMCTLMPNASAIAALASMARSASSALLAYATWMWLALCRAIIWSRVTP